MNSLSEIMTCSEAAIYLGISKDELKEVAEKNNVTIFIFNHFKCFHSRDILRLEQKIYLSLPATHKKEYNISSLLTPSNIVIREHADKVTILKNLIEITSQYSEITSKEDVEKGIFKREELMSTGIGLGVAIPHVRLSSVSDMVVSVALVRDGVPDFQTLDDTPVFLIFMIVGHTLQHAEHLRIVSELSLKIKDSDLREKLYNSTSKEELFHLLTQ